MSELRERNRKATMEHVQNVAFRLFENHGYSNVTIAQIAKAAEVGTTTFYRLFQTKEGLFTATPWSPTSLPQEINLEDIENSIRTLTQGYEWRGMRWVIEEPIVRQAVLARIDMIATQIIDTLVTQGQNRMDASLHIRKLLFGAYFTSLELWYQEGRIHPFSFYFDRALQPPGDVSRGTDSPCDAR